jgi:hypothetical protein
MPAADPPQDRGTVQRGTPSGEGVAGASLEELLGRQSAQLDRARAEIELAAQLRVRLLDEIDRLERSLRDADAERLDLLDKVQNRDRLLGQIFGSRSWRWAQVMRRVLGRG